MKYKCSFMVRRTGIWYEFTTDELVGKFKGWERYGTAMTVHPTPKLHLIVEVVK